MKPEQKILTGILWVLAVMAMVCVVGAKLWNRQQDANAGSNELYVAGATDDPPELTVIGTVPDFSLTDQDGQPITNKSLLGKPFIAGFVYTHCAGPCPLMTSRMVALQKKLPREVQFVTVSVDPTNDTPSVLKQYAKDQHADETRWRFLTGDEKSVFALSHGMLLPGQPAEADKPILHSERFVLVDDKGQIRGAYQSTEPDQIAKLTDHATKLASGEVK